jgi:hypothetical protein
LVRRCGMDSQIMYRFRVMIGFYFLFLHSLVSHGLFVLFRFVG